MKELKVYKTLQYFDVYELKRFYKYLKSPYFNKDLRLIKLYDYYSDLVRKQLPSVNLNETKVWEEVFEGESDFKLLRRLNSDLLAHLTDYLGQQEYERDRLLKNNLVFKGVANKKIEEVYESIKKYNEKYLERFPEKSSEYYYSTYLHEHINSELKSEVDKKKSKSNVQNEITIDRVSYNLDQFYIIEKLRLYITLLSWNRSYKVEKQIDHIDELKQILNKAKPTNNIITTYLTIVKTFEEPDKEAWFKLLRLQAENQDTNYSKTDYKYIYDALLGASVRNINQGLNKYIAITLEIYKSALATGVLFKGDKISKITFDNIIGVALRNLEYDWAEYFIEEYSQYLEEDTRLNTTSFSTARIQFYRKNYSQVIEILREVEYETVIYNLNSKSILLFSYYEIGEYDALDSLINSFKVYLNRERSISVSRKKRYNQLLGFVKRIANINPRDIKKLSRLKQKLEETNGVLNKAWLTEKIEELEVNKGRK